MNMLEKLDEKIPEGVIEEREQAGKVLSYLTGSYVIDRLNQVLGHGNWSYSVTRLEKVFEGKIPQRNGEVFSSSYIASIKLRAKISIPNQQFDRECDYEEVGYGDGTDRTNPGKAHELASKEAVTDAIKRAAKNLGISMGLGLYFKNDIYVEKEIPVIKIPAGSRLEYDPMTAFDELPPQPPLGEHEGLLFDVAMKEYGEMGCLDLLLKKPASPENIKFWTSLKDGVKKFKSLTPKQKDALSKSWWHVMVKPYS